MKSNTASTSSTAQRSPAKLALGLGVAGLLPIPGLIASIAAIICARRALADGPGNDDASQARLGLWLGVLGAAVPVVFLVVYCVVLGYPFPIHRYHGG